MMLTSANVKKNSEQGVTLLELMVALALLALITLLSASSIRASAPGMLVKHASQQLLADFKRARLEAESTNTPVVISFEAQSYAIPALTIERVLPYGVEITLIGGDSGAVVIGPGFWLNGYQIHISKGGAQATLVIDAVTRRARLQ